MFSELQSLERVSFDGNYAFFPNSSSGVPLEEVVTEEELSILMRPQTKGTQKPQDASGRQRQSVDDEMKKRTDEPPSVTRKPDDKIEISAPCGTGKNTYVLKTEVRYKHLPLLAMCCHKCRKTTVVAKECPACGNHSIWKKSDEHYECKHCDHLATIFHSDCPECGAKNPFIVLRPYTIRITVLK